MISSIVQHLLVAIVTGGGGFLGGHVVETFLKAGYRTVLVIREKSILSNVKTVQFWREQYPTSFEVVICDLSKRGSSLESTLLNSNFNISLEDITCIVNCACPFQRSFVNYIEEIVEPALHIVNNVIELAAAIRHSQRNLGDSNAAYSGSENLRIIHVSSSAALRGTKKLPYNTTLPKASASPFPFVPKPSESVALSGAMFSPLDWNTCSKVHGGGMQSYQFAKTVSEQMMFETASAFDFEVLSIVPVTMLGPICDGQQDNTKKMREQKNESDLLGDINEITATVRNGISAKFVKDWHSGILKQEKRLIADVRDVALAILNAAKMNLENYPRIIEADGEFHKNSLPPAILELRDFLRNAEETPTHIFQNNTVEGNTHRIKSDFYASYDLISSSTRCRKYHRRRFIIGGSRRIEHSAVENILLSNGFQGGSSPVSETMIKSNAAFRTDIDELDVSATSISILSGGLGIVCRKWEDTILDTARQFYDED